MTKEQMVDKIVLNERDEAIPEFDRLRKMYNDMTESGSRCSGCRLKRVKAAINAELSKLLK